MFFKNKYRSQSTRLANWDYSQTGCYFVTICVKDKQCCFGEIVDAKMIFSIIGEIANKFWLEIPEHFNNVVLDMFAIMPNHLHGVVIIHQDAEPRRDVACYVSTGCGVSMESNFYSQIYPKPKSLSTIIRSFKSAVRGWCSKNNFPHFYWQPRFYDHIVRNEKSLNQIRQYIFANPAKWEFDRYNPRYAGYN